MRIALVARDIYRFAIDVAYRQTRARAHKLLVYVHASGWRLVDALVAVGKSELKLSRCDGCTYWFAASVYLFGTERTRARAGTAAGCASYV